MIFFLSPTACRNTISGAYLVRQCTSPYLQTSCIQLPHGRSDESRKKLCIPNGLDQSLLVLPNSTSVGTPETHAICISPESSDKTRLACCKMEKAWEEIQQHPSVQYTIDIFFLGFVFFRQEFKVKLNFSIRF